MTRRKRAKALGARFNRARGFELPEAICIAGRRTPLVAPSSSGVAGIFLEVLLDDGYGLTRLADKPIARILDIGANIGLFALAARNQFPRAEIHCYEPSSTTFKYLQQNVVGHDIQLFREAVGATAGFVAVDEQENCGITTVRQVDSSETPQVSLQTAVERLGGCDLAKIDCEGAEWHMFEDRAAWQHIDNVSMEYHLWNSTRQVEDVVSVLEGLGFQVERVSPLHPEWGVVWARRISF